MYYLTLFFSLQTNTTPENTTFLQKKLTCHFEKSLTLKRNEVYFEAIGVVTEISKVVTKE